MKRKLAFASLLVLSACGTSAETRQALQQMNILQNDPGAAISYASQSGSGNDVILRNVELRAPQPSYGMIEGPPPLFSGADEAASDDPDATRVMVARAETLTFKGLTLKDGKPVARDIVATNLVPEQVPDGSTLKLGTLSLLGMNEATGRFLAAMIAGEDEAAPPPLEAWGFDKASLSGLTLAAAIPQAEGVTSSVNVQLGELSFGAMSDRKLGEFVLDGVKGDLDVPGMLPVAGTFDLGRLEIGDLNLKYFSDVFTATLQPIFNPLEPVDYAAMYAEMTSPIDGGIDRIDWTGAKVDVSGIKFDVSPVHIKSTRNTDGVAVAIDAPRYTMTLKTDASGGTLGAMGLMGLAMAGYGSDTVEMFFEGAASFDPEKDFTRWDNYHVGVTDLADVKMSFGILGLQKAMPNLVQSFAALAPMMEDQASEESDDTDDTEGETDEDAEEGVEEDAEEDAEDDSDPSSMFAADPAALMSLMMGVLPLQLTDLDLEITDARLVSMIIDNQAIGAGQSAEAYRGDLLAMIAASSVFMNDAGLDAAIAQELTSAASGFMSGPGKLRIQLKPKTPLGVMSAFSGPVTKDSLGFSATFTPAAPPAPLD